MNTRIKQEILNNTSLIDTTCIVSTMENLSKYATSISQNGKSLELIQLHKGYCNFDGWSEDILKKYGFELLYAEIPQRRINEPYDHGRTYRDPECGLMLKTGNVYTFPDQAHDKTSCKLTLKDKFDKMLKNPAFRPILYPDPVKKNGELQYGCPTGFRSPLILRKLIMMYKYEDDKFDVYHWHKTGSMKDSTNKKREVKTILTHVNCIPIGEIFSMDKHKNLMQRVAKYSARITTFGHCNVKNDILKISTGVKCLMND